MFFILSAKMSAKKDVEDQINDVFAKEDAPKDLVKVNPINQINQGFDGQVKNTDDETLDLN